VQLATNEAEARTLADQGLRFAAESEAAALQSAIAATGINPDVETAGDAVEATTTAALARSLAASMHGSARVSSSARPMGDAAGGDGGAPAEALNERAVAVIRRIQAKLTGRDFAEDDAIGALMSMGVGFAAGGGGAGGGGGGGGGGDGAGGGSSLDTPAQVQRLILAATSHENLCQCYIGWCPFW
jgi:FKBP12-rapamycin complex-associated protein